MPQNAGPLKSWLIVAGAVLADAEGIGEAGLGGAGAQGLLLALVRRPAGKPHHLEGGAHAAVRIGEALGIDLRCPQKRGAPRSFATAGRLQLAKAGAALVQREL